MSKRLFKGLNKEQAGGEGVLNAIKNKIRSREGASITFALLIFLVCAIISGVVIVAGSTASGRMSQIAQTDQRYYAMTSAAGLLRDDIDGLTVTVTYEKTPDGTYKSNSAKVSKAVTKAAPTVDVKEKKAIIGDATCLLARKLAGDTDASGIAPVFDLTVSNGSVEEGTSTTLVDPSFLACQIRENVLENEGQLIFEIFYPTQAAAKYTLQIVFNANISQSSKQVGTDDSVKNVVTTVVEWKFSGIRKGART